MKRIGNTVEIKLSTRQAIVGMIILAFFNLIIACGGGHMTPGTGGGNKPSAFQQIFSGPHGGSRIYPPGSKTAVLATLTGAGFATVTTPSQLPESIEAQCDYSGTPGFLGSVPTGNFVPLALPGVDNPCLNFSSTPRAGIGDQIQTDGTLNNMIVQGTTTTGGRFSCRDLTSTATITDLSLLHLDIVPNGSSVSISAIITPNGSSTVQIPSFTCALTVAPSDIKTIDVKLVKG